MEAIIVTEKERKAWDDFVMDNPASIAWQSYGWSEVVRKHYGLAFYPIAVYDGRRICGILPLYHVKKGIKGKEELVSVPYAVAGGLLSDGPAVQSILLDRAVLLSRQFGSCRARCGLRVGEDCAPIRHKARSCKKAAVRIAALRTRVERDCWKNGQQQPELR